ncbi:protein kinase domain containing protein [Acanthamoeba castellanii str. Neff]|uniref:Protein kinase domain containing protein n=1 Tax=Acanthamoeba castellanii (strain ATCC 30010 / Neff) TaxID=1257118 RepID=L8GMR3_ACACF|nr:protein kinase domain containing protein [Acanthamoeba castellanii str. Neff]ELR14267.1 protein kinase domain containing protein [Acanthamoeba castellanii str. Neff]
MIPEAESYLATENIDGAVAKMEEMKGYKMRNMHLITSDEAVNYLRSLDDWLEQKRVAIEAIRMRRMNLGNQPPASSSSSSPSSQSVNYVNTNTSSPSSSAQYVHFQSSPAAAPASAPAATPSAPHHHQSTSSPSPPTSSQTTYAAVHSSSSAPSPLVRSREVTGNVQYVSTAGDGPKSDGSIQYADPSAASSSAYVDTSSAAAGKGSAPAYAYAKVNGGGDSKPLTYVDYDAAKKKKDSADGDDLKQRNAKLLEAIQSKYNYREIEYDELRFVEKIGAGAFGAVYRGTWRGSVVAIKKLHDFDWFNMETVEEFRREAALAQLLSNHPMVVNFIGACSQAPNFCMVSEFCDQGSLESVLRGKNAVADIPLKTIVRIIRDAAAGIYHLHCEGVIHRDIAARNIMIGPDFSVFVGDFGFARLKEKGAAYAKTKSSLGPVKYMSPESIKEKKYSEKTDAYSFAVLMWEILTRKEPYEDEPLLQIALRVASQGLRLEVPPDTPQPLASLMKECWEQKPDDRPTFPAIIQRLHQFYDSLAE